MSQLNETGIHLMHKHLDLYSYIAKLDTQNCLFSLLNTGIAYEQKKSLCYKRLVNVQDIVVYGLCFCPEVAVHLV